MATGTVNIKLRPIKFAFLVHPADKKALLEAIEINTFLWGGTFNPIIPTFQRLPKVWGHSPLGGSKSKRILKGYLDAYDPDYVVPLGKWSGTTIDVGSRQIIPASEILAGVEEDGSPQYGIGLFEVLQHLIAKELKFVRRRPLDIRLPDCGRRFRHFLAAVFGCLPESIERIFTDRFEQILDATRVSCSMCNYSELLTPPNLFLRRLSSLYVSTHVQTWLRGPCIFFCDASKSIDIIDYWNLRALGWHVIPLPKQSAEFDGTRRFALAFIEENFFPHRFNPQIYHNTTLLNSRSTSKKQIREFAKSLEIPASDKPRESKIVFQHWYPRIWNEWARDMDHVACCELEVDSAECDLPDPEQTVRSRTLDPKFITEFGIHSEVRFANEVEFHVYGAKELLAEVLPEGDQRVGRATGGLGVGEWRFSRKGIVYLSRGSREPLNLTLPLAEEIFSEWLKSKGWEVQLSVPGRIAKQVLKLLGGKWGISTLANEGVIALLGKVEERERTTRGGNVTIQMSKAISKEQLWGEISKIANQRGFPADAKRILQRVIDVQMFRLGLQIQCPTCGQHPWFSLKDADYQLQCQECGDRFSVPCHSPDEIRWSYRPFGPFSSPNRGYGVYSVLLTLRFFSQLLRGASTPMMSFTAERDGKQIEADLGMLFRLRRFGHGKTEVVFAECKTHMPFQSRDVDRMGVLRDQFPGALLVFATLNKQLTSSERRLLCPVVNRGRRDWESIRPFNPVLILTGTELYSDQGPPDCWENQPGKHAAFARYHRVQADLLELCDVTQQLYLGMKSRHQWLDERRQERLHRKRPSGKPRSGGADVT